VAVLLGSLRPGDSSGCSAGLVPQAVRLFHFILACPFIRTNLMKRRAERRVLSYACSPRGASDIAILIDNSEIRARLNSSETERLSHCPWRRGGCR
jgi:hypothetical protein